LAAKKRSAGSTTRRGSAADRLSHAAEQNRSSRHNIFNATVAY
jgi:hypothetical protein